MKKVVLAIDSFKGCLSSIEAEKAAERADKAQANIPKKKVRQTVIDPDLSLIHI